MDEKFVYYLVYERWIDGKASGKGKCELWWENSIETMKHIDEIEQHIRDINNWDSSVMILVLSWEFLRFDTEKN